MCVFFTVQHTKLLKRMSITHRPASTKRGQSAWIKFMVKIETIEKFRVGRKSARSHIDGYITSVYHLSVMVASFDYAEAVFDHMCAQ